jgi:hypothetical protein
MGFSRMLVSELSGTGGFVKGVRVRVVESQGRMDRGRGRRVFSAEWLYICASYFVSEGYSTAGGVS